MASKQKHSFSDNDRKKIEEIFLKLDKNKDGVISIDELKEALQGKCEISDIENFAQNLLKTSDENADSVMSFEEFIDFVGSQETQLRLAFKQMDKNKDNKIDAEEIQETMAELGVRVSINEAKSLLKKMDKDNNLSIDYDEWRNYLLLSKVRDMQDIIRYWRKFGSFDIGENMTIPDDFSTEEKKTGVAWKTLMAGGIAGCISRTGTGPLDRIKVTMQAHGGKAAKHGIVNVIKYMITEGGISALWRGNGVNCVKIAPESAIKFLAYETYKKSMKNITGNIGDVTMFEKFISGALAGATAQTFIYPMEVLKTRMCLRKTGQYSSIIDCAKKIYVQEGVSVFFRGYIPNICGILPYAGIDLALFETFKNYYSSYSKTNKSHTPPIYVSLTAGAVSSVCGQVATYPLALVRTKLQAKSKPGENMMSIFKTTMKEEGFVGLYRGMGPNMLKVIPAVSISYAVYDQVKHSLGI